MAFLDKIKTAEITEDTPVKKVNPLLKKRLEPKKVAPTIPANPAKKLIIGSKPKVEAEVEETAKAVKPEAKEEVVSDSTPVVEEMKKPEITEPEAITPTQEEAEALEEKEATKKEEPKKEQEKIVEPKVEVQKEVAPKAEAKKAPAKTAAKKPAPQIETPTYVEMPTTSMSFSEAALSISSTFVDEEFDEFKEEVMNELGEIIISPDMNPGTLKVVIAELSMLREKVWNPYQEAKNLYERLSSKEPEGLIERVKRLNIGAGNNDMERRRAGIMACLEHETAEGTINLFEMMDESKQRYGFLKSVIDSIKYKTDILITLNGALKLEKEHIQ